ncbi:MAG: hypothetical protein ACRDHP_11795, partial [Ktedonobacterales bacterium]
PVEAISAIETRYASLIEAPFSALSLSVRQGERHVKRPTPDTCHANMWATVITTNAGTYLWLSTVGFGRHGL